jgi:hypothetical protein
MGEESKVYRLKKALYGLKQAQELGTHASIVTFIKTASPNVHMNMLFI